ncbi:MAG: DUF839 domain-containing protein [Polyangiaceae bacterium]|nr:DUF839 domain-containing protein [Polyangiaceae bacterium]
MPAGLEFPLKPVVANSEGADQVHTLPGLVQSIVASWLDPLTGDLGFADGAPFFGANNDFLAYFGEGWDATAGDPPQWHGSGEAAWLWVNHEYVSNSAKNVAPTAQPGAPLGQHATLATFLHDEGVITNDATSTQWVNGADSSQLDGYVYGWKRQVGGSWMRIVRDAEGRWAVDRSAPNRRYDATGETLSRITGHKLVAPDVDGEGNALPPGVVTGILANCSGGQTPWGTVITAEENVQFSWGDLEVGWTETTVFNPALGLGPGHTLAFTPGPTDPAAGLVSVASDPASEFGRSSRARHNIDNYGYLVEIDPGLAPGAYEGGLDAGGPGRGHKKIGYLGRARWENAAIAVGADWKLLPGKRVVLYSGDDRRGGRVYKFVSSGTYAEGMTRTQVRALLDDGDLYVAHFADLDNATGIKLANGQVPTEEAPGAGVWLHLSVDNVSDDAPNAVALGTPGIKIGAALRDVSWNGVGGFADDDGVRRMLFTAANKVGVRELNRPEDLEWNPQDPSGKPRLYIAFSNNNRVLQLDAGGKLNTPATCLDGEGKLLSSCKRDDALGAVFAVEEADPSDPAASATFRFHAAWTGTGGAAGADDFGAANPDNLLIDPAGGVWFGTDGNFAVNGRSDALYYLDLDPAHRAVATPTYGKAFRIVTMPSDAEATGPALSSDARTLFFSVQHPGEEAASGWPAGGIPRSSVVALSFGGP